MTAARLQAEEVIYAYNTGDRDGPGFSFGPLNLSIQGGEFAAILGPNASGKSTALRLLSGLLQPLSGRVRLEGVEISRVSARERARHVALVAQESSLLFPLHAWEYVLQGRYPYKKRMQFESADDCEIARWALEEVGASHLAARWMERISGGEKQRVILARALAQKPSLLLLDEPTQHLDIAAKVELMRRLWRLAHKRHYAIAVVTHELNLAAGFCDQMALLHKGKCLAVGRPEDVYRRPLLEEAFEAPLEVQWSSEGRPRVMIHSSFEGEFVPEAGGAEPEQRVTGASGKT